MVTEFENFAQHCPHRVLDQRGEDCYFFDKVAREIGIKPLIDLDVKCRHVGVFSIEPDGSCKALSI